MAIESAPPHRPRNQLQTTPQIRNFTLYLVACALLIGGTESSAAPGPAQATSDLALRSSVTPPRSPVPASTSTEPPPPLHPGAIWHFSLEQAKAYAAAHQSGSLLAQERVNETHALADEARARLLPGVDFRTYQIRQTENLKALGLNLPGVPFVIGPFDTFDARVRFTQRIFDLAQTRALEAAHNALQAAQWQAEATSQQAAGAAALSYVELLRSRESVTAAQANRELAEQLLKLAGDQQGAGLATGVDVIRAQNVLARTELVLQQSQQLEQVANTRLHRALGIDMGTELVLSDPLDSQPPAGNQDSALTLIQQALESRPELQALQQVLQQRLAERRSAQAESLPSFSLSGDIGSSGVTPTHYDYRTYSYGVQMSLPLIQGGALTAKEDAARSRERQAQLELLDTRQQVEEDVRIASISLGTSLEQKTSAQTGLSLAQRLLEQAQDRFRNGVADNLELVDAQASLAGARSAWIDAQAAVKMAGINLDLACGRLNYHLQ